MTTRKNKPLIYTDKQKRIRMILDHITPVVMRRYKLKDKLNNKELDNTVLQGLKREYLKHVGADDTQKTEDLYELIKMKPRFMIAGENPWIIVATKGINSYDFELFPDIKTREMAVSWAVMGRDTPKNREIACEFYAVSI